MSNFPPDGYTIEAEWPGKTEPRARGDDDEMDGPLPRSVSHRRNNLVGAYEEAKLREAEGYRVKIFQTTNQLVYRTGDKTE